MILSIAFIVIMILPIATYAEPTETLLEQSSTTTHQAPEQEGLYTVGVTVLNESIAYTGASLVGSKEYSIVQHVLMADYDKITGITPELVTLNYEPDQQNPLYNKKILHLIPGANKPAAVTEDMPNTIFILENIFSTSQQSVLASPPLNDVQGNPAQAIVALETAVTGTSDSSLHFYTIAAVTAANAPFGDSNSGLALIKHDIVKEEPTTKNKLDSATKTISKIHLNAVDAQEGIAFGNKAVPLGLSEKFSALNICDGLDSITPNVVDMCWHPNVERLYIALQITTKEHASNEQGAYALLVGRIKKNKLFLDPIVPHALCEGNDKIVGTLGANQSLSLHKVRPFITSLGMRYLIIIGGHGTPEQTKSTVYALPLVHLGTDKSRKEVMKDPLHGTLAAKESNMKPIYGFDKKFNGNVLTTPATQLNDMHSCHDQAVCVGNFSVVPNDITDICVSGDAIFVSVANAGNGQEPGIFHSQAICDQDGRIVAWTAWQRFGGIDCGIQKFKISPTKCTVSYLQSDLPLFGLKQWKQPLKRKKNEPLPPPEDTLEGLIATIFPQEAGGLQGITDFPVTTPGLNADNRLVSMVVATGQKKVALILTGSNDNEQKLFRAYKNNFLTMLNVRTIVFSNDVLEALGSITCAALGTNREQSWLFVAGARGVAVLTDENGGGWSAHEGLLPTFENLPSTMSFKKCGAYRFIQKVICDNNNVYIITNKSVERIPLHAQALANPSLYAQTIVQSSSEIFFDGGVSGPLMILATSHGLLHNPPGTDVRFENKILSTHQLTAITLPNGSNCIYKLFFITRTHHEHDFAHGAQLFASVGSLADNKTDIFKLYIDDIYEIGIKENTVRFLPYQVYANQPTPYISFNNFRTNFITDGTHHFTARSRQASEKPFLYLIPTEIMKKVFVSDHLCYQMPLQMHKANNIIKMVKNSATGNWIVAGDFGIRTNE